jgi:uncharacterized protein YndB with AHSA1/START domain
MTAQAQELAIHKSITVDCSVEHAFEVFTERIADWWPLQTHSIFGDKAATSFIEGRVGGRAYERSSDGDEADWANVLAWEPPQRFALEWRVNPENPPTEVEVRFSAEGDRTRVELEHSGWERYGDRAESASGDYDSGWDYVLGRYAEAANR